MSIEEKIAMLEEIMDVDEGTLSLEDELSDYDEWDSLSKLSLIAVAKEKFGKKLNIEVLLEFVTVKDVCDYLK